VLLVGVPSDFRSVEWSFIFEMPNRLAKKPPESFRSGGVTPSPLGERAPPPLLSEEEEEE